MTPERAREISDAAFTAWETSDDSMQDAFTAAILAATKEERHAALTEAAKTCMLEYTRTSAIANSPLSTDVGTLVHDGMSMGAENCRVGIIALRDKEQP